MDRLLTLLLVCLVSLVSGCWLTPAEAERKILQDPDPPDDATGDTGLG